MNRSSGSYQKWAVALLLTESLLDGMKVGYMYREALDKDNDSGWRFFSGDEAQEYADYPHNFAFYEVNTICNYDPAIIPFLDAPYGEAFGRISGSDQFETEKFEGPA